MTPSRLAGRHWHNAAGPHAALSLTYTYTLEWRAVTTISPWRQKRDGGSPAGNTTTNGCKLKAAKQFSQSPKP